MNIGRFSLFLLSLLVGCGRHDVPPASSPDAKLRGLLVGTWTIEGKGEVIFVHDGTFSSRWTNTHARPEASWYYDGTWAVTGGVCVSTITNSTSLGTTNRVRAGKTDCFRVLAIDDRQLVWECDNQTNSLARHR